jgi:hypothetical protein
MIYVYQCVAQLCPAHIEGWARATGRVLDLPIRCPQCGDVASLVKVIQSGVTGSRAPVLPQYASRGVVLPCSPQ